ncbi:RNAseH domain-containing protein [Saccharothrix sp. CB00851]|uniref:RNAseH domain-containing protein n=1 Tax=Saccharothrix sp. CB00851 TaxID=1835005 RepID=UPI0023790F10|nr:RNAseH domain-containing protein [Saccharothrix sp. CB00851]
MATEAEQTSATAAFVKNTLYQMRSTPTLVVIHAQNTRGRWPWLKNGNLIADRVQVGAVSPQRIASYGKQLRIVRVATGERDETPEWWAPKSNGAGIAKGLWRPQPAVEDNRIFYSTTDKASTHTVSVEITKLTPRVPVKDNTKPDIKPGKNAWNPDLLEFSVAGLQEGDQAEAWAMFLHQQRFSEDYRDGLALPLILHLAELTTQYALPHGEETATSAGEEETPEDDNSEETP